MTTNAPAAPIPWQEAGHLPAIPPPPGITPNFINPLTLHSYGVITQALCLSIATLLILLRLYTKYRVLHNPGWDDHTCVLAWLGLIATATLSFLEDANGYGQHLWDVSGNDFTRVGKLLYAHQIIYNPVIFTTKLSILLLYLRIFKPVRKTFIALHVILWANLLFYTAGIFIEAFQCTPVEKTWLPLLPGRCINQRAAQLSSGVINTISDFAILLLPIGSVWKLQVYKKGKIGLFTIFGFGLFACIASIARLVVVIQDEYGYDGYWHLYPLNLWTSAEIASGIVCSSLPCLPAFIRHISGLKMRIVVSSRNDRAGRSSSYAQSHPPKASRLTAGSSSVVLPVHRSRPPRQEAWEELDDLEWKEGDNRQGSAFDGSQGSTPGVYEKKSWPHTHFEEVVGPSHAV